MIVPSLANKGPVIVARDLCEQFVNKGHECKVFYFDDIIELTMPCEVERISLLRSVDFNNWDVIHTHGLRPDLYVRIHKNIFRRCSAKFISTQHNPISIKEINQTYKFTTSIVASILWHIALTAMDHIVFLNPITQKTTRLLRNTPSSIIFNGRDIDVNNKVHLQKISDLRDKYKIIGTISNIIRRKGLEQMIKALVHLPECAFVAVGSGDEMQRLQELSHELRVDDRCYWAGYQSDAYKYHSCFDAFVMCTRSEGFPLALIESAAYGTPTVLSNIPILTSIIKEPIVEFYQLDNIDDLCAKLNKVLASPKEYSRAIREYYSDNLTADVMAENYITLYKS